MQSHAVDPFGIVGQVLDGQFRIDRLVGEGGFSAVYRGHHLGLQEPIAIKCLKLPPSLSPSLVEQFAKRFRDESRILYRLSQGNLNIVRSIAAGTWQANTGSVVPYMILEWLEGRSLANEFTIRRTIGQQGRSLGEVVKLFGPAADGLGYAHAQGVVHRDLNPGNLFLALTPQGTRMKVLDFGVAKILDDSTLDIVRTQTVGQIRIFAPAYGAPEQFDDTIGQVGAASDVYALALILLEALRDRCVNDGRHLGEFAQKAIDPNRRPTPRMFGLDVPDEVEQIFARATKLDPRERWQSAGELWQALAIAASAASQERHARAAMETPSLAMPQGSRSTRKGIAPPPEPEGKGALDGARLDRTLAIPHRNLPHPAVRSPESAPSTPRLSGPGAADLATTQRWNDEVGDDVTRVRAPEADVLRGLSETEPRGRAAAEGWPPESAKPHAGTLMMGSFGQLPTMPPHPTQSHAQPMQSSGRDLSQTMPLAGPHPLGISGQEPHYAPLPAAGQAHVTQPPYPHTPPHDQRGSQLPGQMQSPPFAHARMGEPASMPPASAQGAPKKNHTVLFVVIGMGALAATGIVLLLIVVFSGKTDAGGSKASTVASSASPSASSLLPSAPSAPPPVDPVPTADVNEDASETAPSEEVVAVDASSTAVTPATSAAATPIATAVARTDVAPVPAPAPMKDAGADPNAFNEAVARSRLGQANGILVFCRKNGGVTGPGTAMVTFSADGTVSGVSMAPPYAGTPVGDCVAGHFKRTKVSPFLGSAQTLKHSFEVPK